LQSWKRLASSLPWREKAFSEKMFIEMAGVCRVEARVVFQDKSKQDSVKFAATTRNGN